MVLDISDFHVVFVISDSRCRGHLWDVWPPVGSEKTETSYLAAFVGGHPEYEYMVGRCHSGNHSDIFYPGPASGFARTS